MKLKRPVIVLMPRPQVFLAALLAAMLSTPFAGLAAQWDWSIVWAWLAATLAGLWLTYFVEVLVRRLRRLKS